MREKDLPSTLDEALTPVNPGRRRFLGRMLVGAAALTLLLSAGLAAGAQHKEPPSAQGPTEQPKPPSPPVFAPGGGTYTKAQLVTIMGGGGNAGADEVLYYTTNGSAPSGNSTQYTGPITISTTTTVNAIGCNGGACSSVAVATYTITAQ